jgi:hypothetical protein
MLKTFLYNFVKERGGGEVQRVKKIMSRLGSVKTSNEVQQAFC